MHIRVDIDFVNTFQFHKLHSYPVSEWARALCKMVEQNPGIVDPQPSAREVSRSRTVNVDNSISAFQSPPYSIYAFHSSLFHYTLCYRSGVKFSTGVPFPSAQLWRLNVLAFAWIIIRTNFCDWVRMNFNCRNNNVYN